MARRSYLPLVTCLLSLVGCGGGEAGSESDSAASSESSDSEGTAGEAARPNWHQDVAPLVAESCRGCHTEGGIAPFSMDTYAEASPWASLMALDVEERLMPPWHALETEVCQPPHAFKHDPRLTDDQIALLRGWADLGAPEGDPALAATLPDPPSLDLASPSATVTMGAPLTIEAQDKQLDFFHCLSFDPGNAETVYLDGLQVIPGNRGVVHHVLVYVDADAESASWPSGVKEGCDGGTGVSGPTQLIAGWVPGGLPMEPPPGVGIELPAGARLIFNVHYHATGGGAEIDDATRVALRWTTEVPEYVSRFELLGAPGAGASLHGPLEIPAGEADHVEEYEWTVSAGGAPFPDTIDVRVWAVAHHMHKVGVDIRAWLVDRDTGDETCLLHAPRWDFDWQRVYEYDAAVTDGVRLRSGDVIRVRCVYDNTLDNPGVVEALAEVGGDAPIDVTQGEGTLDEMCLTAIGMGIKGL